MSKNTKNIILGVIIGAILVAGGQYAWTKYQANQKAKSAAAFVNGLNTAKDQTAYLNNYIANKSNGLSVGLSNSNASTGGGDGSGYDEERCQAAINKVVEWQGIINSFCEPSGDHYVGPNSRQCEWMREQQALNFEEMRPYCSSATNQ